MEEQVARQPAERDAHRHTDTEIQLTDGPRG